ncbi:MAG: sulfurtransferase [Alphaproteobacteria bacterium]|nr:sulfurtransferase [Alphaproteobacteria bacterium]
MDAFVIPRHLHDQRARGSNPLVIDVRRKAAYDAAPDALPGALRRLPETVDDWVGDLELARAVVVYCVHGHEVSQGAAAALGRRGRRAAYLADGIEGWRSQGFDLAPKPGTPSLWVTRERPKIDRIACPWLIRRFIDPDARFLYVPTDRVFTIAAETGATPYDIPGAKLSHRGELCSFDAFLDDHGLDDAGLRRLAVIVRGADTSRPDLTPESPGLFAISLGLGGNITDDGELLRHGLVMYDALYRWILDLQGEAHAWPPAVARP